MYFSSKNLEPDKPRIDALPSVWFPGFEPSCQSPIWNAAAGNRINLVLGVFGTSDGHRPGKPRFCPVNSTKYFCPCSCAFGRLRASVSGNAHIRSLSARALHADQTSFSSPGGSRINLVIQEFRDRDPEPGSGNIPFRKCATKQCREVSLRIL